MALVYHAHYLPFAVLLKGWQTDPSQLISKSTCISSIRTCSRAGELIHLS
jgi:hypothetical protein